MPDNLKALLLNSEYRERLLAIEAAAHPAPWTRTGAPEQYMRREGYEIVAKMANQDIYARTVDSGDEFTSAIPICADQKCIVESRNHFRAMLELIGELQGDARQQLFNLQAAQQHLVYLWEHTGSCPCGARKGSPNSHPHVTGCPTGRAASDADGLLESVPLSPETTEKVSRILRDRGFSKYQKGRD